MQPRSPSPATTCSSRPVATSKPSALASKNNGATFRGVGATRPIIDGAKTRARGFNNNGANQLTIENFEITGQTEAGIFTSGSNNTVVGNVIHHIGSQTVREAQGVRVNRGSGNRVAGNTIHHIGPGAGVDRDLAARVARRASSRTTPSTWSARKACATGRA